MSRPAQRRWTITRSRARRASLAFYAVFVASAGATSSHPAHAQDSLRTQVGIAHIGAIEVHVGSADVERTTDGKELGGAIDLGWFRNPRLRIQAEVGLLRALLTEFVESEDSTYSGRIFDLTASMSAVLLLRRGTDRVVPYLAAGLGVHALSSTLGTAVLDKRYNANPFGLHVAGGLRVSLTRRNALQFDVRSVVAENVNRTSARLGAILYFGDLVRPR